MKKKSNPQSAFFNLRVLAIVLLCPLGVGLTLFASGALSRPSAKTQGGGGRTNGGSHKLSVRDRQLAESLKDRGARLIGDYGSFVLLEANDELTRDATANAKAEIVDFNNAILLNAKKINTNTAQAQSLRRDSSSRSGKQMRLIQFKGPIRPEWYQALQGTGARIVTYIPNNAYLVYGEAGSLAAVRQLAATNPAVQWDGEYLPAYRLDPAITGGSGASKTDNRSAKGNEQFSIQLVEDATENATTLAMIEQLKLEPVLEKENVHGYVNIKVALPRDAVINQIAQRGDVVSIQHFITPKPQDERQDVIMSGNLNGNIPIVMDYFDYLTSHGINIDTVASFGVNLSDTGVDNGTQVPNHFGLYKSGDPTNPANSRIIYNRRIPSGGGTIQGCDGHGNINAHIIGGYVPSGTINGVNFDAFPHADASLFHWGRGMAPFVKIGSSVIFDPNYTFPTFKNIESQAYRDTARISSNSWGSPGDNAYDSQAQAYDFLVRDAQPDTGCSPPDCISVPGNQEYTIVFAAGNSGPGTHTVSSPSTAKNVICVGAAENVNLFGGADRCGIPDTGADSANDIIGFSGRGPTSDNRIKPDIMGPGTHVSGGVAQQSIVNPTGSGTGSHLPCFNGTLVCGGPSGSLYFPLGQEWYTASSGTSHSTPATSGASSIVRQQFINLGLTLPGPAMVKGLLMNSARYMTGVGANDTLPSNNQGMGEIDLNNVFDTFATAHSFHDQLPAELFTASGQQQVIGGTVPDSSKPFRVTLAWTDAPGPTSGNAFVNNLDLTVTVGGNTYIGNVFSGAFSTTGGTADTRNNVESVFIPAGVSGPFTITINATNIAGDGVPGNGFPLDQDFALIAYNGVEGPPPTPSPTPTGSPVPTPTATPASCSWAGGPDMPMTDARSVGVFFPTNGKFYVMGGRDLNNVELTNPFEYDPVANTWTTKSATYPDANTNNMACSVPNDSGTDFIYCAGGSNFATQTGSGRVFRYDPITDTITSVSSNWPPGDSSILPGGFSVFNNTLVILGGFDIPNGIGIDQIWQFTPSPAGWVQKNATLPVPLGYLPTTTIGSLIYTGGGADITGGALTDTTNSFVYDPVADSINTIAPIPRPTSNTRAVNFCNQMYVLGGGFTTPSNEVDIYDPGSNTWSLGVPFPTAGRNFAADTDGTNNIWKAGGYASDGATIIATTELFNCPVSPCGSASPTPTATATATATASATATATATATPTPRPTPTPRSMPTPRPRPTPAPRP